MIKTGDYNILKVLRHVDFGFYLDDGASGILLPKRYAPKGLKEGDEIEVFIYHDGESRIIATTEKPLGKVGDFVKLRCVSVNDQGAFMDWGIMKDLFVPKSQQITGMMPNGEYVVKIYRDLQTNRTAATERVEQFLSNESLTLKEGDEVSMMVLRRTDIGYVMILNNEHTGVLHHNEVFRTIGVGDKFDGFVKKVYADNKIDVVAGKMGYSRVEDEASKIMRMLEENNGFLPYNDKSDPEAIYLFFSMSKKTFKMTVGNLYRERKIVFENDGIKMI